MAKYDIGDTVKITVGFSDASGASIDPTTVGLKIRLPNATILEFFYPATITKSATGKYFVSYLIANSKVHYYKWTGTGNAAAVQESSFSVSTPIIT